MEQDEFIQIVQEILEVPAGTVTLDSDLRALGWDSLADISFIATIDEKLAITLDPLLLAACENPAELLSLISETTSAN